MLLNFASNNRPLAMKITILVVSSMIFLATTTYLISVLLMHDNADKSAIERQEVNMRVAWSVINNYGPLRLVDGKMMAGDTVLNDNSAPVDHIKELVGGTATIFQQNIRVTTNVKKPDGSRAVGTELSQGPVWQKVMVEHQPFRGRADILGKSYYTAYDPMFDQDGQYIGILYTGILADDFLAPVQKVTMIAALAAALVSLLTAFACFRMTRRMFAPLDEMSKTMEELSRGNLNVIVQHTDRSDEIGAVAKGMAIFRQAALDKQQADAEQAKAMGIIEKDLALLARGDLTARVGEDFPQDYKRLGRDFDHAVSQLGKTIDSILKSMREIHQTAAEITNASNDLATRTERQASNLEGTVTAVGDITRSAQQSAEVAERTGAAVQEMRQQIETSGAIVLQAMGAMRAIERSSSEITNIIALMDGIAFQTNLLALNAGVEAARAGEAGKGFAVVASEVRQLAQRSAEAANDVKTRIATSTSHVQTGVTVVAKTNETLNRAIEGIGAISTLIAEITVNVRAQSEGVLRVNAAIGEMDQVTQQNAAMVEETTASARNLTSSAERLVQEISHFQLPAGVGVDHFSVRHTGALRRAG